MYLLDKIKKQANKLSEKLITKIQQTEVENRIFHIPYPTNPSIFKDIMRQVQAENIQVWNLSEYPYVKETHEVLKQLKAQVHQLTYQFYSCMPLTVAISSANKIKQFLKRSPSNCVLVHCQQNKSRTIVFLAIYLYLSGSVSDIASALAEVNQKLGIKSNQTVYSSQHFALRHLANYHRDPNFINQLELKLLKVIINEAPKISQIILQQEEPLLVFLQIRKKDKIIFSRITKQFGQGEIVKFNLDHQNILLSDDCLFSFKYILKNKAYPVARIQINTNFIFNNFLRVQRQQMDLSQNAAVKGQIFVDFLFQSIPDSFSELYKLNKVQNVLNIQLISEKSKKQINNEDSQAIKKQQKINIRENLKQNKTQNLQVEKKENDEPIFDISEGYEKQAEQFEEKLTNEKLQELLKNMAIKDELVNQKIIEENSDEETNQLIKEQVKKQEIKTQQVAKQQQKQETNREQETREQSENQKFNKLEQRDENTKVNKEQEQHVQEQDIEDYLSALEKQAADD